MKITKKMRKVAKGMNYATRQAFKRSRDKTKNSSFQYLWIYNGYSYVNPNNFLPKSVRV